MSQSARSLGILYTHLSTHSKPINAISRQLDHRLRGQSDVIGVILLTAVIVVLVGGFGAVYLSASVPGAGGETPLLDANVTATADSVSIEHVGGESIQIDDLAVVVRSGETDQRFSLDRDDVRPSGDDRFDPGETVRRSHTVGTGQLEVLVIHTASNTVVHHAYLDVRPPDES